MDPIKLTHYAHGAGCGCKIAPAVLEKILRPDSAAMPRFDALLIGYETRDDAAVMALDHHTCLISTTDFFMPIVDDAYDFGAIAAANALSDVYAMGGKPIMALAILGWPVNKLPETLAARVLDGARHTCRLAGIPLAGGHSIDSPEPFFGLAATGIVKPEHLKRNNTALPGNALYLTKPLGSGIITTAARREQATDADLQEALTWMKQLNHIGEQLGRLPYITAMTDVTGFGLLGHLAEMCEGSHTSAQVVYNQVPLFTNLTNYTARMIYPDNTMRNWQSYNQKVSGITAESLLTLCDPQTNGGLLVCVQEDACPEFERFMQHQGMPAYRIGRITEPSETLIAIQ